MPVCKRAVALALFPLAALLLPAGCPSPQADGADRTSTSISAPGSTIQGAGYNGGSGTQTAGSSQAAPDVGSGPSASFSDPLTARYAECLEPVESAAWRAEIFNLVNRERAARGLSILKDNSTLAAQAEEYACELIHYDFFAHVNPVTGSTLSERSAQFDYEYRVVGENLAAGQRSPEEAFLDWMESPGHRANILDARFSELGVGIRTGGSYGVYWVQEFGQPLGSATQP